MQSAGVPGSPRTRSRFLVALTLAACGWASWSGGCGGYSSTPTDAGTDGKAGSGGGGTGGKGVGGMGVGGTMPGVGGAGTGGTAGTGAGGTSDVGGAAGTTDAGTDMIVNLCGDAGPDASMGDMDGDQVIDCLDGCPTDPNKTAPGVCGCGVSDMPDMDNDGVPDCVDACPNDPLHSTAGVCGCGIPEGTPLCLVHRYSFKDTTATIADSITIPGVSPANGTLMGSVTAPANDRVTLAGGLSTAIGGQFVSLPAGIISKLGKNATFEAWVTWSPVAGQTDGPWQRVFDFGSSDQPAGTPGIGQKYIFLTPLNGGTRVVRAAITYQGGGSAETVANGTGSLATNTAQPIHLAVVVNGAASALTLYVDGVPNGVPGTMSDSALLARVVDDNNWIGRSQWAADQLYAGAVFEFRIYSRALSAAEIAASRAAGPDTLPGADDGGVTDGGAGADGGTGTGGSAGTGGAAGAGDASSGQ